MKPIILAMPGSARMASAIALHLQTDVAMPTVRAFPDGETYLRIDRAFEGRPVAIVDTLSRPDAKFLPLVFAADAARDLGASKIGLVAPYLAYMRQDRRFEPGEAITSRSVARLISGSFDWLVTVDPHLHRYKSLSEIYTIPSQALHATDLMGAWIGANVESPFLIGPDEESLQWVRDVARIADAPFTVLQKTRLGDRDVETRLRDPLDLTGRTPVLVDDIISSGETMLEALHLVKSSSPNQPVCVAVHGIFADQSDVRLQAEGAYLVTSNTIAHPSNAIDASSLLAAAIPQIADAKT